MSLHRPDPPTSDRRCGLVPPSVSGELLRLRLVDHFAAGGTWPSRRRRRGRSGQVDGAGPVDPPPPHPAPGRRRVGVVAPGDDAPTTSPRHDGRWLGATRAGSDPPARWSTPCGSISPVSRLPRHRRRARAAGGVIGRPAAGRRDPGAPGPRSPRPGRAIDAGAAAGPAAGRRAGPRDHPGLTRLRLHRSEVATVAGSVGRDVSGLDGLGGWPALVRLAVGSPGPHPDRVRWASSSGRRSSAGFVHDDLRALFALATVGTADADTLAAL